MPLVTKASRICFEEIAVSGLMDMIATFHKFTGAFRGLEERTQVPFVGLLLEAHGGYCSGVRAELGQLLP